MKDEDKTKEQLRNELVESRQRITELEVSQTERKQAEEKLRQANRTLRLLSTANQAMIRARDESELMHQICRIAVEVGGYRFAWVGFAEERPAEK